MNLFNVDNWQWEDWALSIISGLIILMAVLASNLIIPRFGPWAVLSFSLAISITQAISLRRRVIRSRIVGGGP